MKMLEIYVRNISTNVLSLKNRSHTAKKKKKKYSDKIVFAKFHRSYSIHSIQ